MKNFDNVKLKKLATPMVIGGFFLMAVTGILMFFHKDIALNKLAHEWVGFVFVFGGLLHLLVHYKSFFKYWGNAKTAAVMVSFLVILFASFFALIKQEASPARVLMKSAVNRPLIDLIPLSGRPAQMVLDELALQGFVVENMARDSVNSISGGDMEKNKKIINLIFSE